MDRERATAARQQEREAGARARQPGFFGAARGGRPEGLGRTAALAPFRLGLDAASASLRQFKVDLGGAYYHMGPFSFRVGAGAGALIGLATGLKNVAVSAVETAADFERVEIAFEVMTGSADRAKAVLQDIFQFAAVTPFEIKDVVKATQQFTAVGIEAELAFQMVKRLGNIAAAMPEGMAENLNRVVRALAQMHAKGTVQAEEMTRQLANAGIPAWQALAEHISKVEGKLVSVAEVMERTRNGMVSARVGIEAILELATSPRFAAMQARQAQTMLGLWSTLKDNVTLFMADLGKSIIKGFDLKGAAVQLTNFFGYFKSKIGELEPAIMKIGTVFRAAFDVGLGILKVLIDKFSQWTVQLDASPASLEKLRNAVIHVMGTIAKFTVQAFTSIANIIIETINLVRSNLGPALGGLFEGGPGKGLERIALGWRQIFKNIGMGGGIPQEELNRRILALAPQGAPPPIAKMRPDAALKALDDMLAAVKAGNLFDLPPTAEQRWIALGFAMGGVALEAQKVQRAWENAFGMKALTDIGAFTGGMAMMAAFVKKDLNEIGRAGKNVSEGTGLFKIGDFGKGIHDVMKKAHTPFQELKNDLRELDMHFKELSEHAAVALGRGLINPLLLADQGVLEVKKGLDAVNVSRAELLFKARKEMAQGMMGKDTPALVSGSPEAVNAINKAINDQARGQMSVEQLLRLMKEQDAQHQKEIMNIINVLPGALRGIGLG